MKYFLLFLFIFSLMDCGTQPENRESIGDYGLAVETDTTVEVIDIPEARANEPVSIKNDTVIKTNSSVAEARDPDGESSPAAEADGSTAKKKDEVAEKEKAEYDRLVAKWQRLKAERENLYYQTLNLIRNNPRASQAFSTIKSKLESLIDQVFAIHNEKISKKKGKITGREFNLIMAEINQLMTELNRILKDFILKSSIPAPPLKRNRGLEDGLMRA